MCVSVCCVSVLCVCAVCVCVHEFMSIHHYLCTVCMYMYMSVCALWLGV